MNVKLKNILIVMALLSLLILMVVGLTYRSTRALIDQTISGQQLAIVANAAQTTEVWLSQQMKILNATASSLDYNSVGENIQTQPPLKMAMKAGHFSDVYIGLIGGLLIDGADWLPPESYDPRVRPWYKRAVAAGRTAFTTPYLDFVTSELVIALVTPLSHNGEFIGVMGADTVLDTLVENVVNTKVGKTGYAFIAQKNGMILVHPHQAYVMKVSVQQIEPRLPWAKKLTQDPFSGTLTYRKRVSGVEHILAYQQIKNTDWYLCTTVPLTEASALTRKTTVLYAAEMVLMILGGLAFLTLAGGSGSVLVLWLFSKRFQLTVLQQQEKITDINENLVWNINKRKEVETYYQTLFQVANDAVLLSRGLQYVECNEKATEMFGQSREQIIGCGMLELSPRSQPDGEESRAQALQIIERANADEQQFFEWTFQREDGTEFPAEVGLKVLRLDNEELVLASIRDISKRVDAEEQLRQTHKMAAMGEMLGAIAHQWRQPLNTLSTYIASIPSAYYNHRISKPFVEKFVLGADSQIQFMSKTIDDFRHFFRPSKQKKAFDLVEAVGSAIKLLEPQLNQNEVMLTMSPSEDLKPLIIFGYQSEFVHVVVNILGNAMDSFKEKSTLDATEGTDRIEIRFDNSPESASISVTDNGCGIPESLLPKIFTPYFTTKGTASGTGIGLYMAKMIVEKEMDGLLTAENAVQGTRFTICFPHDSRKGIPCLI